MKTNNVGGFIQQLRKDKGMTQKELAEIIGMSDKTISKWESGNSLPDTSVLVSLCEVLDISVNELLSCEKIPPEDYSKKAEENIMTLMKENEENKKVDLLAKIIGIVLLVVGIFLFFITTDEGYVGLTEYPVYFLDALSLIFVVLFGGRGFDSAYISAQLAGGGLMLGALFMATDYVTRPITKKGQYVYGMFLGILTGIFRLFGPGAEGVSYAIIIGNLIVPLIEKWTLPKAFGKGGERA